MRDLLAAHALSPVRTRPVASAGELAGFVRELDGPVILKPAAGTGSSAVFRVGAGEDTAAVWARFAAAGGRDAVAEEFLDGPEISVETFSHDGRHTVVAVTDKTTLPSFVETGHTLPSTHGNEQTAAAAGLARAFLDAVGLREGPAHTEMKLTPGGPRVIESHNRIGGDKIRELVRRAYRLDLVRLTAGVPFGLLDPPQRPPEPHGGAAIRFLTPRPGTVRRIGTPRLTGADDGTPVVSLDVEVGDVVRAVRSSADRAGYVLAEGTDATEAAARCERISRGIRIETEE
nr:ATP-grasp domain-containing protein [Streptomyces sp. HNM0574]